MDPLPSSDRRLSGEELCTPPSSASNSPAGPGPVMYSASSSPLHSPIPPSRNLPPHPPSRFSQSPLHSPRPPLSPRPRAPSPSHALPYIPSTPPPSITPFSYAASLGPGKSPLALQPPSGPSTPVSYLPSPATPSFSNYSNNSQVSSPNSRDHPASSSTSISIQDLTDMARRRSMSGTLSYTGRASLDSQQTPGRAKRHSAPGKLAILQNRVRFQSRDAKKLFAFITINAVFSTSEMLYGLLTSRITLVSDAFHLWFGCGVLTLSLVAMAKSRQAPDAKYTYGYERLEVLAGFTNTLFLLFLSFSLSVEALTAFIEDESEHRHYLTLSAATNLVVNVLGVIFFRHFSRIRVVYRRSQDMNHHSIFLHVLADSIRSGGIILASWLLAIGLPYAETLVASVVALVVLCITLPLFYAAGAVLLQTTPPSIMSGALDKTLREARWCDGVLDIVDHRFWALTPGATVGTLHVKVGANADEQRILKHIHSCFNKMGVADLTVQIEKDSAS